MGCTQAKQAAPASKEGNGARPSDAELPLIKEALAHFCPPVAVGGTPREKFDLDAVDAKAKEFAAALASHGQNEDLIGLFAADGSWTDPVGGPPPYIGTEALVTRIAKLPPMDNVEIKEVFYTMSPKTFCAKTEVTMTGKSPFIVIDRFVLDDDMKITSLESHFHAPTAAGGAPREKFAAQLDAMDALAKKFAAGLLAHDLVGLFHAEGSWSDPVGGPPPNVGTDAITKRQADLPAMDSVEVEEVFYTMSDKICLAKNRVTFTGKPSFIVFDKFTLA